MLRLELRALVYLVLSRVLEAVHLSSGALRRILLEILLLLSHVVVRIVVFLNSCRLTATLSRISVLHEVLITLKS